MQSFNKVRVCLNSRHVLSTGQGLIHLTFTTDVDTVTSFPFAGHSGTTRRRSSPKQKNQNPGARTRALVRPQRSCLSTLLEGGLSDPEPLVLDPTEHTTDLKLILGGCVQHHQVLQEGAKVWDHTLWQRSESGTLATDPRAPALALPHPMPQRTK